MAREDSHKPCGMSNKHEPARNKQLATVGAFITQNLIENYETRVHSKSYSTVAGCLHATTKELPLPKFSDCFLLLIYSNITQKKKKKNHTTLHVFPELVDRWDS